MTLNCVRSGWALFTEPNIPTPRHLQFGVVRRNPLFHSHFPVRHLIRQVELYRERGSRTKVPAWLEKFVTDVSEAFEPFRGVARVGYEAHLAEAGVWEIALFLGDNESVGGSEDGRLTPVNFRFDLDHLRACFTSIQKLNWNVFPNKTDMFSDGEDLSFILVEGSVESAIVRLQLQSAAPEAVGPGLRHHQDGEYEVL